MKDLIIIGASGLGREIYDLAKESLGYGEHFCIKGFLDINHDSLKNYPFYPQVISSEDNYEIQPNDVFICALGEVRLKRKVTEKMIKRGANFFTLIHSTAHISPSANIGKGSILLNNVSIGSYVSVGDHCLIQTSAILGHDVQIGDFTRIDCNTFFVGGVIIKEMVTIHTAAVINHNVIVENNSTVGACSFVIKKVKENTTVFGNPAKELFY